MLATSKYPVPIEWAYKSGPGGLLTPLQPGKFMIKSQDISDHFHDAGCFAIYSAEFILEHSSAGTDTMFAGFEIPRSRAVDIDTEDDWAIAEALFLNYQNQQARVN